MGVKRRPSSFWNLVAPTAKRIATGVASAYAYNKINSLTKTKRGYRGVGVTAQHDKTQQYRRRRMPYKKRKRWVRFTRKVQAVNSKVLGTKSVIFNDTVSCNPAISNQAYCAMYMYGGNGTNSGTENGTADLQEITISDTNITPTGKIHFTSACIDLTMVNTPIGEIDPSFNYTLEVDVYVVTFRHPEQTYANFGAVLSQAGLDTPSVGTGPITIVTRGSTLFDIPTAISYAKMKILKKSKYLIGPGLAATYQYRQPGNRMILGRDMNRLTSGDMFFRNDTYGYIIVAKCVDSTNPNSQLVVRGTRSYKYHITESQDNQTGVL